MHISTKYFIFAHHNKINSTMKRSIFFVALSVLCTAMFAQVTTVPAFIPVDYEGEITVIFNPNEGNGGMKNAKACYAHTGLIVGKSTWQNTIGSWLNYPDKCKMTQNAEGNWELKITPNAKEFYGYKGSGNITGLCFVFNDGQKTNTKEGKTAANQDIFVYFVEQSGELVAKIATPASHLLLESAQTMNIECAATVSAEMSLSIDGTVVKTETGTTLSYSHNFTNADTHLKLTATANGQTVVDEKIVSIMQPSTQKARPAGIDMGIYYNESDPTKVTLATYAASKTESAKAVYVVGDFNDWTPSSESQLYQDGNYFWREITGLTPQKEYAFQYLVVRSDGVKKYISDLFSEKLLHPDDKWEPKTVNPDLMDYPDEADGGYVTVIQTGKTEYPWSDATKNFRRPDKNNLIIYETWVYDFTPFRSFRGLMERLDYIEGLGVNAVELMPVTEFDGNNSWGYSPNHYFAVDKAYGSAEQLKQFIDECHKRGIAVILDMVFNHATGLNPMNKLYPYGSDLKNNPWFNVSAPHPDNVYEDWNHNFEPAHKMFIRAFKYWLEEFKIDGYRLDLSHGLCGTTYNAVDNLKDYYQNGVQAVSKDAYMMLEHWGNSMGSDRPKLVSAGMLCWQNTSYVYAQTAGAWLKDDDLSGANQDGYVSYCNNHDEERPFAKAKMWGEGNLQTSEADRCARVPLNMAFLCLLNGSHLFYHYDELGYDYSKFQNAKGQWGKDGYDAYGKDNVPTYINEEVKMQTKASPVDMGWFENADRMGAYQKTAQIIQLRTRLMPEVFAGNPTAVNVGAGKAVRTIQWGNDVFVAGNFSATNNNVISLPSGTWYDYFAGSKATVSTYTLKPGEVLIFTGKQLTLPNPADSFDFSGTAVENTAEPTEVLPPYDVYVYTTTGQLVYSERQASEVNTSNLESGMYIIRLISNDVQTTMKVVR